MSSTGENGFGNKEVKIVLFPPALASIAPVNWVQLDMLHPGDLLAVKTETSEYLFSVTGTRTALMVSSNPGLAGAEVILHGSMGEAADDVAWGKLLAGKGLVFEVLGLSDTIRTSPIARMQLRKCAASSSIIVQRPPTPAVKSAAPVLKTASPVVKAHHLKP
jgi:hypothetical protein